jgi:hypothetical protein
MKYRLILILLPVCTLLAALSQAADRSLPLTVDWGGTISSRPLPVTGGIPFGRGDLADPAAVRLTDAVSREVPLQAEVLARWPDGSVKWLLLDFQSVPSTNALTLLYGAGVKRAAVPDPVRTAADGESVNVETSGGLAFSVRRHGNGFLDAVRYDGRDLSLPAGSRANYLDAIHAASPADYPPFSRYVRNGEDDPSAIAVDAVTLETAGPLRATVRIEGRYRFRLMGSTIEGTDVKGDCPFRLRLHAYAGQSFIKVEHFFCYEGDGDRDFLKALGLRVPLPSGARTVRSIVDGAADALAGPLAGICQETPDSCFRWTVAGGAPVVAGRERRFEGVLDVAGPEAAVAVGVKEFWQNAAKALHADLPAGAAEIAFWPPEAPPLDFRRHAREWSVGEAGEPDDKDATVPAPFTDYNPHYRLASKGTGKTHYALVFYHEPDLPAAEVSAVYRLLDRRPLLWAPARHYAATRALGRYRERVAGEYDDVERAMDQPIRFWAASREKEGWYGFLFYGNVCQSINQFLVTGRWDKEFGRWGWGNGDSVGRLGYALMLQALRTGRREDAAFAEAYVYNVHDVCSTHTPSYPVHYRDYLYVKGAAHRHGAWPWACPYIGIRGAHPVGAKIHYFLTGEGHSRDILDEIAELAVRNPNGGMGDGPLGPNAQIFLYRWETTGQDEWRDRIRKEIENSDMARADSGWTVMMDAAFGIYNALEEYMELSGDRSLAPLAARFADAGMPEKMRNHWTWAGYYRVYAAAYNLMGDAKYARAIEEMLPKFVSTTAVSAAGRLAETDWPGPPGGPTFFVDGNAMRDIPFALEALEGARRAAKGGTP